MGKVAGVASALLLPCGVERRSDARRLWVPAAGPFSVHGESSDCKTPQLSRATGCEREALASSLAPPLACFSNWFIRLRISDDRRLLQRRLPFLGPFLDFACTDGAGAIAPRQVLEPMIGRRVAASSPSDTIEDGGRGTANMKELCAAGAARARLRALAPGSASCPIASSCSSSSSLAKRP